MHPPGRPAARPTSEKSPQQACQRGTGRASSRGAGGCSHLGRKPGRLFEPRWPRGPQSKASPSFAVVQRPRAAHLRTVSEGSVLAVLPLRSEFFHAELPADLDPPSRPHLHPAPRNAEEVPPARSRRRAWTSLRRCRSAGRWGEAQLGSGEVLGAARGAGMAHRAHTRRLPPSLMSCDCPNHQLARRRHYTVPSESARHGTSESS